MESSPLYASPLKTDRWAKLFLQAGHRLGSIGLILFILVIASNTKNLGWPNLLPSALLFGGAGLAAALIGWLLTYGAGGSLGESVGLIIFCGVLLAGVVIFRIATGTPLHPLPFFPT